MLDKITCAEFQAIYVKLTSNQSVSETKAIHVVDECVHLIMNNLNPSLVKDLQVNNECKSKFDVFWDICSKVLEELTVVNIHHHCLGLEEAGEAVMNMAVTISTVFIYTINVKQKH